MRLLKLGSVMLLVWWSSDAMAQPCQPYWTKTSSQLLTGLSYSLVTFDKGAGPAVYLAGSFIFAGGPGYSEHTVLRWNGQEWIRLDAGLQTGKYGSSGPGLEVLDDGLGPRLYAYGSSYNLPLPGVTWWVRRLNAAGTGWEPAHPALFVGGSGSSITQFAQLSADLGEGMRIYGFRHWPPGGQLSSALIEWTGQEWVEHGRTNLSAGMNHMIAFNDGSGPALVIAGGFDSIAGVPLRNIAKWDGQQWSPLGSGIGFGVRAMAVYDDGRGPALYIVGSGLEAGGVQVRNVARWDGVQWEDVGGGTGGCVGCPSILYSAAVFDDGTGPGLYVGGYMTAAGGVPARGIARWNGIAWSALGPGVGGADLDYITSAPDVRGSSLFAASVYSVGGGSSPVVGQWVGCPNCYANCDLSTTPPRLNVADFGCFLQKFAANDPYANCNIDAVIDVADFACFMQRFAAGCP